VAVRVIAAALSRAAEHAVPAIPGALDAPLASLVGTAAYLAAPRARDAVRANLAVIRAATGTSVGARQVFVEQVRHYVETFRLLRLDRARLLAMVEIEGWQNLTAAAARGKGVVLASAHLGPVVLCGQVLAARGLDVSVVVEPKAGEVGRLIDRARSSLGMRTVETTAPQRIVRSLRQGGIVGVLADRAVTGVGERVPFFGRDALLPSGHVALALRTGAPLVPGFSLRDAERLRAYAEPEIELARTGDHAADVHEGVRRWAEVLQSWVARAPEQWSVFEPVWQR
jgi:KDO2-lipid IV(A) lauroyltransferase